MHSNGIITFIVFLSFIPSLYSQIGVGVLYTDEFNASDKHVSNREDLGISLGYNIGIESMRSRLSPSLFYGISISDYDKTIHTLGVNIPVKVYILNLSGGCDCPTIEKENNYLKENLFISINPSAYLVVNSTSFNKNKLNHKSIFLGGGIGIDIPLSSTISLTPSAYYQMFSWTFFPMQDNSDNQLKTDRFGIDMVVNMTF